MDTMLRAADVDNFFFEKIGQREKAKVEKGNQMLKKTNVQSWAYILKCI